MTPPASPLAALSWKDPDVEKSLANLREYVEAEGCKQVEWYYSKKRAKALASTSIRFVSIVLFVLGGLVPIVKATLPAGTVLPFDFGQAGYLLIGLGAGCIGMDRYFGYSSGWIRYITTAMAIEKSLEEFRYEWTQLAAKIRGNAPTEDQVGALIQTCAKFSLAIKSQVEQETKAWVTEFQSNLAQLEKDLQSRADEVKQQAKAAGAP